MGRIEGEEGIVNELKFFLREEREKIDKRFPLRWRNEKKVV